MVRRIVVWAGSVVIVLVAACGDGDADAATHPPPVTTQATTTTTEAVQALRPGPVTSFENIAGTYQDQGCGGQFLHFFEDGTLHGSSNRDLVVDRPETVDTARFEEVGAFLLTTTSNACPQPDQGGTYEILVLENGNLEFVAVDEDTCAARSGGPLDRELAPVP